MKGISLLDAEALSHSLDDHVNRIFPKVKVFKEYFLGNILSSVMICSDDDFSLLSFHDYDLTDSADVAYFDLSSVTEGDYELILRELSFGVAESGILLDNIDRIPDIPDKEDFEYLVRMALKRDYLPTAKDRPIDMLDFSKIKVGAKCSQFPDYLKGKSLQAYFTTIEPETT